MLHLSPTFAKCDLLQSTTRAVSITLLDREESRAFTLDDRVNRGRRVGEAENEGLEGGRERERSESGPVDWSTGDRWRR